MLSAPTNRRCTGCASPSLTALVNLPHPSIVNPVVRACVTGSGTFEIGGEVAVTFRMDLQVQIDVGFTNKVCYFTNSTSGLDRRLPMMDITVVQTNGTPGQTFTLRLAAAPVREIWFSTAAG